MKIDDNMKILRDYLKCTGVGMSEFTYALDDVVSIMEEILKSEEPLQELIKEYAEQDNRITAYPIYVTVQEQISIGVMADGYTVNCPFGDGLTLIEYRHASIEGTFHYKKDLIEAMCDYYDDDDKEIQHQKFHIEELNIGYIWTPVEFFLTIKGAEQYMKANKHNHGKLRTYVHHFERRNFEMRELLKVFGFKIKD